MHIYSASYLVVGISVLFWAIFVFLSPPRDATKQAFSRYLIVVGWWALFSVLMINSPTQSLGLFWDRICLMGVVFIPATFIHFNFTFLGIDVKYKKFIYSSYLISLLFFLINLTPYLAADTTPKFGLNFYTDPGPFYLPFMIYFFSLSILGIYTFYWGYRQAEGNRKRQLFNIFWSSLLGYSLGGFNYNLAFGLGPAYLALVGNLGIILHVGVYAYSITKQRMLDISVVISRLLSEIITTAFFSAVYLFLLFSYAHYSSDRIGLGFIIFTFIFGIMLTQTYQAIRLFVQTTSDKLILHGKYDYYKEISEASIRVGRKLSLEEILKVLYATFFDVVEIHNPRIFLPEFFSDPQRESRRYVPYDKKIFAPVLTGEEIGFKDPLVGSLIEKREPIINEKSKDRQLVVPCMLEDRLIALFVLGSKLSQDPYTDEDVQLLEVLASQAAISLDHTRSYEKIRVDLEATERQLERSSRLASIGTLTAGVTHEIRNPLTVIRTETERLTKQPRDADYLKQYSDLMLKHIERITGIIHRMLTLAKDKPQQEVDVNLNEVIEVSLELVPLKRIVLKKELRVIPPIKGDNEGLQEVFVNLIQNALNSMPDQGTITLRTYLEDGRVVAEVEDTGKGIPDDIKEKIFDPFFSTRHEGTGLGLSIAYRIIRSHGGDIKVTSQEGKGTTFKLVF
ncbi:hypothetical protein A2291_00900 [candidate division WOR-1 bacterium RIFOXYB2_FULL_42_35]|uniref:histidine kinase n=1 Tax=candidate division WOR-1 bacterium RIFOXYC2_FULL_41_25 TaxID=1802586 RepID=A0A1F4TLV4_UNCSA|nr:MAG: hypothetical protein A2247_05885 [candidate division WOR-1 bacterium RIFOXYA2_FULL_41_14]OGC23613.1 MAG: hypothetical protein A2291_00900 [candidate division WOR-1 bacterium RIFOXYB2_FULL_42_35]OGC33577.1 MAG: hypothetical protein A2462_02715 [candidate division WOR-1 bacterium RIFOXYC2_FULL_41_25]